MGDEPTKTMWGGHVDEARHLIQRDRAARARASVPAPRTPDDDRRATAPAEQSIATARAGVTLFRPFVVPSDDRDRPGAA